MSVYFLPHRLDVRRSTPPGGLPQDAAPRRRGEPDRFTIHLSHARAEADSVRKAGLGIKQPEIDFANGDPSDPFTFFIGRPPSDLGQTLAQSTPLVPNDPPKGSVTGVSFRRDDPVAPGFQPAPLTPAPAPEQTAEAAPTGEQETAAEPESPQPIPVPEEAAPEAPVRMGHHGQIGMRNPAMDAYTSFDPAQFGSYLEAIGAAAEMQEDDAAVYGEQMASRMLTARGGKAFQYFSAMDPANTPRKHFASITRPWVTAYNGGLAEDVLTDLRDGHLQFSDIPEHLQDYFYRGLRRKLSSTGLYTGRMMPTDVETIIRNWRVIHGNQQDANG